ncbi:hypothetical protein V8B55DRAFT_1503047 [Mucor lusitanicus]|uniref:RRM domain-containing protein n=2 Tax=Mucor circinelloides f. lusitanicus TaxID=29924 RepID=A0A168QBG5_MUCCL|nr:hypothetical protein FB192DRAFT_1366834 [Mucor lusitanicus]OAD08998.1 hypothetical protein MUCCIDRAFT_76131 [Mucor lusitanicus CBS 277.49]
MSDELKPVENTVTTANEEERESLHGDVSRRRSLVSEDEDEELDEFGRVKRRREKFKRERSEENEVDRDDQSESDRGRREDKYQHRRHRRRSSSGSRSPRRSHRRRYSDPDSDYEHHRSDSRNRHRRNDGYRGYRGHHGHRGGSDPYSEAAQYIDTEFYPTKVYIGGLENVDESQIKSVFSRFGPLESVKLVEGKDYGFITFEKKEAALSAIQSMHGALLGARRIKVNRAKIPERNKVGFGNVPWQDEDGLMAKEASFDNYVRRRSSTIRLGLDDPSYPSMDPATAAIPHRVLTSYDDL